MMKQSKSAAQGQMSQRGCGFLALTKESKSHVFRGVDSHPSA